MKDYTPPFFSFPKGYGREVYQTRVFVWDEREFIQRLAEGNGIVNCYMTVYPIPAPRDYEGARVDRIWFDFDRKYTASPYLDTRRLSDWCARVGLLHSVISSGRGYHTHIYSETLTHDQRSTLAFVQRNILGVVKACPVCLSDDVVAFPQEFKHQCNKCGFTDSTSRFSIHPDPHFLHGNLSVMCRAPFTLNMNAGCIAYPIPRSELLKGEASVDEYRRRTKYNGEQITIDGNELFRWDGYITKEPRPSIRVVQRSGMIGSLYIPDADYPPCIAEILKKKHPEHNERFLLVTYFHDLRSFGSYDLTSPERDQFVSELLVFFETLGWDDHNTDQSRYQVENIVSEKYYKPLCGWIMSNHSCPRLCAYYR